jgi:hypothetical protein
LPSVDAFDAPFTAPFGAGTGLALRVFGAAFTGGFTAVFTDAPFAVAAEPTWREPFGAAFVLETFGVCLGAFCLEEPARRFDRADFIGAAPPERI